MNRRDFFGRAAALPVAIATGITITARAPAHLALEKPSAARPPIAQPSPAPDQGAGGGLAAPQLIRTTRELVGIYDLIPAGVRWWTIAGSDWLGSVECFTLDCEGPRFNARHVHRLLLNVDGMVLADVPGELLAVRTRPGAPRNRIVLHFGESLLDLRRVAQLGLGVTLVDRCKPYRVRVFITHWIGGTR